MFSSKKVLLPIVNYLVKSGEYAQDILDKALRDSAIYGHSDIVFNLHKHGANIHSNNDYALKISTKKGYTDIVNYINNISK